MNTYFSLKNFSFSFEQSGSKFFDDISFDIETPGLIFIVGKNGIGKSTFLRCLQGMVSSPESCSGVLLIKDRFYNLGDSQDRDSLHNKSRTLYQSFDSMLASKFTGFENLAFAKFRQNPDFSIVRISKKSQTPSQYFDIPLEKQVAVMSGGQRQMLGLLMVAQKPISLLLLDEPTAALDSKNSNYVMQGIRKLAQEKNICIICISHDADLIKQHADYIITIAEKDDGSKTFKVVKGF